MSIFLGLTFVAKKCNCKKPTLHQVWRTILDPEVGAETMVDVGCV